MKYLGKIIEETFQEIYENTSPATNFLLLKQNPPDDKEWFRNYQISESLFEQILNKYAKKYNLRGSDYQCFKNSLYLGPSPVFKKTQNSSQGLSTSYD